MILLKLEDVNVSFVSQHVEKKPWAVIVLCRDLGRDPGDSVSL